MFVKCQCSKCKRERSEILADRIQRVFANGDSIDMSGSIDVGDYEIDANFGPYELPPVSLGQGEYRTDITPTVRRIDWTEVCLWIFAACVLLAAGFCIGSARVGM